MGAATSNLDDVDDFEDLEMGKPSLQRESTDNIDNIDNSDRQDVMLARYRRLAKNLGTCQQQKRDISARATRAREEYALQFGKCDNERGVLNTDLRSAELRAIESARYLAECRQTVTNLKATMAAHEKVEKKVEKTDTPVEEPSEVVTLHSATTATVGEACAEYTKMRTLGVPPGAIHQKMSKDGKVAECGVAFSHPDVVSAVTTAAPVGDVSEELKTLCEKYFRLKKVNKMPNDQLFQLMTREGKIGLCGLALGVVEAAPPVAQPGSNAAILETMSDYFATRPEAVATMEAYKKKKERAASQKGKINAKGGEGETGSKSLLDPKVEQQVGIWIIALTKKAHMETVKDADPQKHIIKPKDTLGAAMYWARMVDQLAVSGSGSSAGSGGCAAMPRLDIDVIDILSQLTDTTASARREGISDLNNEQALQQPMTVQFVRALTSPVSFQTKLMFLKLVTDHLLELEKVDKNVEHTKSVFVAMQQLAPQILQASHAVQRDTKWPSDPVPPGPLWFQLFHCGVQGALREKDTLNRLYILNKIKFGGGECKQEYGRATALDLLFVENLLANEFAQRRVYSNEYNFDLSTVPDDLEAWIVGNFIEDDIKYALQQSKKAIEVMHELQQTIPGHMSKAWAPCLEELGRWMASTSQNYGQIQQAYSLLLIALQLQPKDYPSYENMLKGWYGFQLQWSKLKVEQPLLNFYKTQQEELGQAQPPPRGGTGRSGGGTGSVLDGIQAKQSQPQKAQGDRIAAIQAQLAAKLPPPPPQVHGGYFNHSSYLGLV